MPILYGGSLSIAPQGGSLSSNWARMTATYNRNATLLQCNKLPLNVAHNLFSPFSPHCVCISSDIDISFFIRKCTLQCIRMYTLQIIYSKLSSDKGHIANETRSFFFFGKIHPFFDNAAVMGKKQ